MQQSLCTAIYNSDFLFHGNRRILRLYKNTFVLTSFIDCHRRHRIDIATEFRKRFELTELSLIYFQCTSNLLHGFYLSVTTYTGNRDTHIDSWTYPLVKQCRFQEYLSVGNRNHVRRDISRNVSGLCLDNRQSRQRSAPFHHRFHYLGQIVHRRSNLIIIDNLSSSFEQTGMQIEYIARIGLTTGRTTKNQRNFTIGNRLLR